MGRDRGSGGNAILGNIGPLLVGFAAGGVVRKLIATNAGLLLFLGLVTTLDLALVKATLDTDSEGIRYLY